MTIPSITCSLLKEKLYQDFFKEIVWKERESPAIAVWIINAPVKQKRTCAYRFTQQGFEVASRSNIEEDYAGKRNKRNVIVITMAEIILGLLVMIMLSPLFGYFFLVAAIITLVVYYSRLKDQQFLQKARDYQHKIFNWEKVKTLYLCQESRMIIVQLDVTQSIIDGEETLNNTQGKFAIFCHAEDYLAIANTIKVLAINSPCLASDNSFDVCY